MANLAEQVMSLFTTPGAGGKSVVDATAGSAFENSAVGQAVAAKAKEGVVEAVKANAPALIALSAGLGVLGGVFGGKLGWGGVLVAGGAAAWGVMSLMGVGMPSKGGVAGLGTTEVFDERTGRWLPTPAPRRAPGRMLHPVPNRPGLFIEPTSRKVYRRTR